MKILWIILILLACSSTEIFNIDYDNEETTYHSVFEGSEKLLKEKRYKEVEYAYNWLKEKQPKFYNDTVFMKHIELYGLQERFEVQLDYYKNIFKTDSADNEIYVPHFYSQIGKSYYSMAKAKVDRRIDTLTVKNAISYFQKAYKYQLHIDPEINASSLYFEALCQITLNDTLKAKENLNRIIADYQKTKVHPKAYFKSFDLISANDIELTETQMDIYRQKFSSPENDSTKIILEEPNEDDITLKEETLVDTNTVAFPKQIVSEEKEVEKQKVKQSIPADSTLINKTEPVKKTTKIPKDSTITNKIQQLIKKKQNLQKKQKKKTTSDGAIILENTED